ncbi:MAG TPA: cyclic nucleotide-binding domain-containing protein [Puia sp.]|uniref:Crp/Fnr family transcriptional regulator n=1 Tax=Puia sp. TaxID=2045100 RepID=UPI002BAEFC72|nr:cyclic nucleotide-binding domain-containing protein [Puia sp.]HVU95642.1 cyclic nucleotide-binding domain-containing protein [Puia sp.]
MEYPLSQLRRYHSLTPEFIRDLESRIRRIEAAKNNTLLLKGDICRDLYLIEKGTLGCYDSEERKRYYTWIFHEGDFVTAVDSFNNQTVSSETIVALSFCVLWAITKKDLDELTAKFPEFGIIRQILTDKYHIQSRVMDAKRKRPPEQFYEYLLSTYPYLQHVPATALASLMGITRTTLYEIIQRKKR